MKAELYWDGGARPTNPGPAGFGVLVQCAGEEVEVGRYIGWKTNNEAEFYGLIVGLKIARDLGASQVVMTGDSLLIINTVTGEWSCKKDHLRSLMNEARKVLAHFSQWEFKHVRGHMGHEENERVDTLCTNAILYGISIRSSTNPFTRIAGKIADMRGEVVDPFQ